MSLLGEKRHAAVMRVCVGFLVMLVVAAAISACGFDTAETVTVPEAEPYRLDNGDRLRITVFGQDTVSGEYVVDGGGFISLPLLEQVEARGRTASELEQQIAQRLTSEGYLINPSVNVQILTYRPFFILGEVNQPGQFAFVEGMTVLTGVAMSGGFTHRADSDGFTITRRVGNKIVEARANRNTPVKPGDVIYVHQRIL
jgi:polysaccharide biosynthesis/export protein